VTKVTRADDGFTLTEVLIAVVILSVAVVALLASLGSEIFTARVHRDIVTSDAIVRRYGEQLLAAPYSACPLNLASLPAAYQPAGLPAGYNAAITNIEFADASNTTTTPLWGATCASNSANEMERITIIAGRGPAYIGRQQLQIIKRNPA
jgi:prepilin-type N-terminal cleavage/methylation domain-containing protein